MPKKPTEELRASNFRELRAILARLPQADEIAASRAAKHWASRVKPLGSLGLLEDSVTHCARWQQGGPHLDRTQMLIYAGNHGVTEHGVSAYPASVTSAMVEIMKRKKAAIAILAEQCGSDLRVFEMNLEQPVRDSTQGSAMDEEEAAHAICFGMFTVDAGMDGIGLGEVGIGNTTAAAALVALHFPDTNVANFVGRGTGLDDQQWEHKVKIVEKIVAAHRGARGFDALAAVGGRELAALAGAMIAARMSRCMVMLDGFTVGAVALALHAERSEAVEHCLAAHMSAECGHARVLEHLNLRPLLNLDLRLGEGSGAALALGLLKSGVACYQRMGSLVEATSQDVNTPII